MIALLLFLLGTAIGSFLNVVAYRTVQGLSPLMGTSFCPHCKHRLYPIDLLPVLSFVFLNGKCRYCKKPISIQYPLVEIATGTIFAFVYVQWNSLFPDSYLYLMYLLFSLSVLMILFLTDIREGILPNSVTLPAIVVVAVYKLFLLIIGELSLAIFLLDFLSGLVPALLFLFMVILSGETAMGGGDVKLVFLLGILVGWPSILVALFLAFLTGGFMAVMLILLGRKRFGQTIPFGPFLTLGAAIALLYGQQIIEAYLWAIL
jgi:leader peptidase (prepilin peptidase)/N-methyltransferase